MLVATFGVLVIGLCARAVAQNVLIVDLLDGYESTEAQALGFTVTEVTTTQFSAMTTQQFASYDAIVLGDNFCSTDITDLDFLNATKQAWSPAITGNVILLGTDPTIHSQDHIQGATDTITSGISFVVSAPSTGLYFSLACYYMDPVGPIGVESLSELGNFIVEGKGNDTLNDVHIVASSPGFNSSLSDADLSDWHISVHEVFTTYPSDFVPLAIARSLHGNGEQSFADGSFGIPYILARGVIPVTATCGDGAYQPQSGEECDDGSLNGTPGSLCSSTCSCLYGVQDPTTGSCNPAPAGIPVVATATTSSTTSFQSLTTQISTYPITTVNILQTSTLSSVQVITSTFISGSSTGITTATSTIIQTSVFTTSSVVETSSVFTSRVGVTQIIPVTTTSTGRQGVNTAGGVSRSARASGSNSISRSTLLSRRPSTTTSSLGSSSAPGANPDPARPPGEDYVDGTSSTSQLFVPSQIVGSSGPSSVPPSGPPSGSSSGLPSSPPNSTADQEPLPAVIGQSTLMGCYGSDDNYPGYTLAQSDPMMTLEMCIETCSNHAYAGAYFTNCYCSDIETQLTVVPGLNCNIPCPGNSSEHCGGLSAASGRSRRQTVPDNVLLSIYAINRIQVPGSAVVTIGPGVGMSVAPSGKTLTTATFLSTRASTITSCAPTATGCTVGSVIGVVFTVASIGIVPVATTAPSTTTASQVEPTADSCVGGYCANGYIMELCTETPYPGSAIFIREPCACPGGYTYIPAPCSDTTCSNIAVYTPVPYSSFGPPIGFAVYQPQVCEGCSGGVQFVPKGSPTATGAGGDMNPSAEVGVSETLTASSQTTAGSGGHPTTLQPSQSLDVAGSPTGASGSPTVVVAGGQRPVAYLGLVALVCGLLIVGLI